MKSSGREADAIICKKSILSKKVKLNGYIQESVLYDSNGKKNQEKPAPRQTALVGQEQVSSSAMCKNCFSLPAGLMSDV